MTNIAVLADVLNDLHGSIQFDEKKHRYSIPGVESLVPVTSACDIMAKPVLIPWAAKLAREGRDYRAESKAARDLGSRVHRTAENWVRKTMGLDPLPIEHDTESAYLATGLTDWLEKKASLEITFPFLPERRLWHPKHGYAGTCDFPVLWRDSATVLDIKTGPKADTFYEDWLPQNAAYRAALQHHTGIEWQGGIILCAKDGSEPKIIPLGNDDRDFEAFLGLLTVYKWTKRNKGGK